MLHEFSEPVVLRHVHAILRHPPRESSPSLAQLALPGWETTRLAHRVRGWNLELTQHSRTMMPGSRQLVVLVLFNTTAVIIRPAKEKPKSTILSGLLF